MPDLERVYARLPTPLQHLALSAEGWRVRRERTANAGFARMLREVEARSAWSPADVRRLQDGRVRMLVGVAAERSPFWRRRIHDAGIRVDDVSSIDDLRSLPVLTKQDILDAGDDATTRPPRTTAAHTSGTTGGGFRFLTTPEAVQEQWAVWWRYRRWHGVQLDTPCGQFAGRSVVAVDRRSAPYWRYDLIGRRVLFSAYHLNESTAAAYAEVIRRRRLPWLHGYPSFIALLAGFVVEQGIDPGSSVTSITTGAENLLPVQADVIERAFGVRPTQHYGLAEAVANASECPSGRLHLDEDFAAVELVPREAGDGFRLIGTALSNTATPLLRYDTGDVVSSLGTCGCGRPGRVVEAIDGRAEDYVVLGDGTLVGRLDHVFKDLTTIREAQIHQQVAGAVVLKVVRRPEFGPSDEARLLDEVRRRLGTSTTTEIEYVDALPRTSSGKLRLVVSAVAGAQIGGPGRG